MTLEEREAIEDANRLAQELLDRDWREQGVSQEALNQTRLLAQQCHTALDAGETIEEILRQEDKTPRKKKSKQKVPVHP